MQEKITVVNDQPVRYAVQDGEIFIDIKPLLPSNLLAKKMMAIKGAARAVDPAYGDKGRIWFLVDAVPDVISDLSDWPEIHSAVIESANTGKLSPRQIAIQSKTEAAEKLAMQEQTERDFEELRKIADALRKDLADQNAARQLEIEQTEAKRLADFQAAELAKAAEQTAAFEKMKADNAAQAEKLAKFEADQVARTKITANWVLLWFRNPSFAVFGSIAVALVMGLLGYESVQAMFPDFPLVVNIGLALIIATMQLLFAARNYYFWGVKATWWLAAFDMILLGFHMKWAPVMLVKIAFTAFIPFIIAALADLNSESIVLYEEKGLI